MHAVGHHLQIEARCRSGEERDLFARSAYNRYYYDVYLKVRNMIEQICPERKQSPDHADIPEFLNGAFKKKFNNRKQRAQRVRDYQLVEALRRAQGAISELSVLMKDAYAVRVVADYKPHVCVDFTRERFTLNEVSISRAHEWSESAGVLTRAVVYAWSGSDVQ